MLNPTRITLAEAAYAEALADARARSTAATWRRLVRAGENLRAARAETTRRRGRSILLVDDEASSRDALRELLERHGHSVITAEHGVAALDLLRRRRVRPSAIVLDLDLPHMTGQELRQELLRDPALARIPVVVVSGSADRRPVADARRVDKPVEPAALFAALSGVQPPRG